MKLQRLIAILTVLLQRQRISATALAEKFEVSVRTIYRDMQTLEEAGIPILTHTGINGGFSIVEEYKIDKKLFTHQDITTLLTSLHSVSGPLSEATVNQTLEKIKGLIPPGYGQAIELTSKQLYIDMAPWAQNPLVTETMALIKEALAQSRLITFEYRGRYDDASRTVEPHQLILKENNWYLRAWCTQREAFRTFKLNRIHSPQLQAETFTPRPFENDLDDFKDWQHPALTHIDILVDDALHERVLDFCRPEYIQPLAGGKLAVKMPFVESDMGYGVLLGLGHQCEVLGPPHIRNEFIHRARLLNAVYP